MNFIFLVFLKFSLLTAAQGYGNSGPSANPYPIIDNELLWFSGLTNKYSKVKGTQLAKQCLSEPTESPLCQLVEHVKNNHSAHVDIAQQFKSRVVYVGEVHIYNEARDFLIKNMEPIKKAGYTHIAMEMWNSSQQSFVDKFNNEQVTLEQLAPVFSNEWGYKTSEYVDLMCVARKNKIELLALDARDHLPAGLSFMDELNYRDKKMAFVLSEFLKSNPKSKVIVLSGRLHAYSRLNSQSEQLSQPEILTGLTQIQPQSFTVVGEKEASPLAFATKALSLKEGFIPLNRDLHYWDGAFVNSPEYKILPPTCF
ncbi:MAG: ChaN family lipoprotein [Bdellovibrionaceae bacterium]|nr:ChaN family lipoprotein [Pseudobdellovibrionaceae bacterium]